MINHTTEIQNKWEKGKQKTLWFYEKKLPWKSSQFNKPLKLPKYFSSLIGDKKEVTIAEIGCGMFCTIGSMWKDVKVNIHASDVLADEYNSILKKNNINPLIPVHKEDMEHLSYEDNYFDIVHCVNALDHTTNPLLALKEMYRVCKPNGYIYLRHFPNVGVNESYAGMHMWNININEIGNTTIWNQEQSFILENEFEFITSTMKREMDYETVDLVVTTIKKK